MWFFLLTSEKSTVGIYWNNAAETWIDIRSTTADKVIRQSSYTTKSLIFLSKNEGMLLCGWTVVRPVGCPVNIVRSITPKFVIGTYKGWPWHTDDDYWITGQRYFDLPIFMLSFAWPISQVSNTWQSSDCIQMPASIIWFLMSKATRLELSPT